MVHPSTSIPYAVLGFVLIVQALLVFFFYSKVRIFRFHYHVPILSNNFWIVYFVFAGIRSILLAIIYARSKKNFGTDEGYQLTNWILGSIELLLFCFGLNYQRKIRCHDEEVTVNAEDLTRGYSKFIKSFGRLDGIASALFVLIIGSVIVFCVEKKKNVMIWFWCYFTLTLVLIAMALGFAVSIFIKSGIYQPGVRTKCLFIVSVLMAAPERIPIFVWDYCIGGQAYSCWRLEFDMFDLFLVFKIMSALSLFVALVSEFNRLKEEVKYSFLKENLSYEFEE